MNRNKVCAIVVTYNRKELLEKQIDEIINNQIYKIDTYYIVDNCSTDSTRDVVEKFENNDNVTIKYLKTLSNCGGAGGFSYGLKKAYDDGYDWYILMDDDGRPYDNLCFQKMIDYINYQNLSSTDLYLLNSIVQCDQQYLSFGLDHIELIKDALE